MPSWREPYVPVQDGRAGDACPAHPLLVFVPSDGVKGGILQRPGGGAKEGWVSGRDHLSKSPNDAEVAGDLGRAFRI